MMSEIALQVAVKFASCITWPQALVMSSLVNNDHVVLDSRRNDRIQECLQLVKLVRILVIIRPRDNV